ncbi:MAG: DUF1634 domain-containing protein [Syntrophobacteraceae bacterium]|nr:DUF1634 domain-containing protein [Syntrophobacteraceae bacterium]
MSGKKITISDETIDVVISLLLRVGVAISSLTVLAGGLIYLIRNEAMAPNYHIFMGEPSQLRSVPGVVRAAATLSGRGIIQLGLLILIATPIMRVAFTVVSFLIQKDRVYVGVTLIVLSVLLFSLAGGR